MRHAVQQLITNRGRELSPYRRAPSAHCKLLVSGRYLGYPIQGSMNLPRNKSKSFFKMDLDDAEKTAFLSCPSDRSTIAGSDTSDPKPPSWPKSFHRLDFVLHLVLITLYTLAAISFVRSNSNQGQCLRSPNGDDSAIAPSPLPKKRDAS